jgi:hypothetical protein
MRALLEVHLQSEGPRPRSTRSPEKLVLEEEHGHRAREAQLVRYQLHSVAKVRSPVSFCRRVDSNLAGVAHV